MTNMIQKDSRIDLRVKADQKKLLIYAASLQDVNLSVFVMMSALKEAQQIVTEKVHFTLQDKQWKSFCDRIDRPAKSIPKLKKLFARSDIFDE